MLNAYCVEIEKKIVSDYEDFDAAEDASFPENLFLTHLLLEMTSLIIILPSPFR